MIPEGERLGEGRIEEALVPTQTKAIVEGPVQTSIDVPQLHAETGWIKRTSLI